MKKLLSTLTLLLILVIISPKMTISAAFGDKAINATKGTPTVDGELEELWYTTEMQIIDTVDFGYFQNESETTGTLRTMWDDNYLYIFVEVDKHGVKVYSGNEGDLAANDCVCLAMTLDGNPSAAIYGGSEYAGDLRGYGNEYGVMGGGWLLNNGKELIQWKFKITGEDTYQIEVAIPWFDIGPDEGDYASLEVCINSMQSSSRRAGIIWAAEEYWGWQGSDCHGTIELCGASDEVISDPNNMVTTETTTDAPTTPAETTTADDTTVPPASSEAVTTDPDSSATENTGSNTTAETTATDTGLQDTTDTSEEKDDGGSLLWILLAVAAVIIIAVVALVLAKKKKK